MCNINNYVFVCSFLLFGSVLGAVMDNVLDLAPKFPNCKVTFSFAGKDLVAINRTDSCVCNGAQFSSFAKLNSGNSVNLKQINLQDCGFLDGILRYVNTSNKALTTINLGGNSFSEPIPAFIATLSALAVLDIRNNKFTTLPSFRLATSFTTFVIANNSIAENVMNAFPASTNPNLIFSIAGNKLWVQPGDPLPQFSKAYINATTGVKNGLTQLNCLTFLKGTDFGWCKESVCQCEIVCGNGIVEYKEDCDGGACCFDSCFFAPISTPCNGPDQPCSVAQCTGDYPDCTAAIPAPASQICRPSINESICDAPEFCTGSEFDCPPDEMANSSTICRAATGDCDIAEFCNGNNSICPNDTLLNSNVVCRSSNGSCDIAENCTGMSTNCPADAFRNSSFLCRASNDTCDADEFCTLNSSSCPQNAFKNSSTVCRSSISPCDFTEYCRGNESFCGPDLVANSSTICRSQNGTCDVPELCDGYNATCPFDSLANSSVICRPQNDSCDVTDFCNGTSSFCPDGIAKFNVTCRPAISLCDFTEVCNGTSKECPADNFTSDASVVCRAASGLCDFADTCSGLSPSCPFDRILANGTTCRNATGLCDITEVCNGTSGECPRDSFKNSTSLCRANVTVCDISEFCSGQSAECPDNIFAEAGLVCRPSNASCDYAETCTGNSSICPENIPKNSSNECRPKKGLCDIPEFCNGIGWECPVVDRFENSSTLCGNNTFQECDAPEFCTGTSASCPPDLLYNSSRICRSAKGECDISEFCTGNSVFCPSDFFVNSSSSIPCRPTSGSCDIAEFCSGNSAICPPDIYANQTLLCRPANSSLPCDAPEFCLGNSTQCPADQFVPALAMRVCRPLNGSCDAPEFCSGISFDCPADLFHVPQDSGDTCLPPLGQCGQAQYCNGLSRICPPRSFTNCLGGVCDTSSGACHCANNRTIYPSCKEFCGDAVCNQNGAENCVNCPSDCVSPCGLCGDGACSAQIGESCTSCYDDCNYQDCKLRPCAHGCVNGNCNNGKCVCFGSYVGPTCSYKSIQVSVSVDVKYPSATISASNSDGSKIRFSVTLATLQEIGSDGSTVVRSLDLTGTVFNVVYKSDSSLQIWTFTASISGQGQITVYLTYSPSSLQKRSLLESAQKTNSFQFSTSLSPWSLKSDQNTLKLITETTVVNDEIEECQVQSSVFANNLEWFVLNSNGVSMFLEPAQTGLLDGNNRYIKSELVNDATLASEIPFAWYNFSVAHTFGFFQDSSSSFCSPPSTAWQKYLIIPFVILGVVILVIIAVLYKRQCFCFRKRRHKASSAYNHPMSASTGGSEMVILASSTPSTPVIHAYVQQDPRTSLVLDPRASLVLLNPNNPLTFSQSDMGSSGGYAPHDFYAAQQDPRSSAAFLPVPSHPSAYSPHATLHPHDALSSQSAANYDTRSQNLSQNSNMNYNPHASLHPYEDPRASVQL